jgi:hypothetical protein
VLQLCAARQNRNHIFALFIPDGDRNGNGVLIGLIAPIGL